jgi:G:T-mismatch repair DNA endonuclease (very short patch repair protein)
MTDTVDSQTRSRMMSGIRGKNTKPELVLRRSLHALGLRYRLHAKVSLVSASTAWAPVNCCQRSTATST